MNIFFDSIGADGVIHALARFEGEGMTGDAQVNLPPDAVWNGVPYAEIRAALLEHGQWEVPPDTAA